MSDVSSLTTLLFSAYTIKVVLKRLVDPNINWLAIRSASTSHCSAYDSNRNQDIRWALHLKVLVANMALTPDSSKVTLYPHPSRHCLCRHILILFVYVQFFFEIFPEFFPLKTTRRGNLWPDAVIVIATVHLLVFSFEVQRLIVFLQPSSFWLDVSKNKQ